MASTHNSLFQDFWRLANACIPSQCCRCCYRQCFCTVLLLNFNCYCAWTLKLAGTAFTVQYWYYTTRLFTICNAARCKPLKSDFRCTIKWSHTNPSLSLQIKHTDCGLGCQQSRARHIVDNHNTALCNMGSFVACHNSGMYLHRRTHRYLEQHARQQRCWRRWAMQGLWMWAT